MRLLFSCLSFFILVDSYAGYLQNDTTPTNAHYVPNYAAPADAPYRAEEIIIKTKAGHILAGTLTLPKNISRPVAAVVTITGSSPQDRDHNTIDGHGDYRIFQQLADTLGRRGIAVLRMDDRGVGGSSGDFWSATTADRAKDIMEGIAYLRCRHDIDSLNIALVGLSEGGMIAPMIAAVDRKLAGIVLLAGPASTGQEILIKQIEYRISQEKQMSKAQRDSAFKSEHAKYLELCKVNPWVQYFWSYDPAVTARKVSVVPVFILQGTTDRNVPYTEAAKLKEAFQKAGNNKVTVKLFPNINHIFLTDTDGNPAHYSSLPSFKVSAEILGSIANWLCQIQLKDKPRSE